MSERSVADLRRDYRQAELSREDLPATPLPQIERWTAEARRSGESAGRAWLGWTDGEGRPDLAPVDFEPAAGGLQISGAPTDVAGPVTLTAFWPGLERQLNLEGDFGSDGLLVLREVEFWQGRPSRLHDRFRYYRKGKTWTIHRLSP
jgi:pyridoxine/pyridoxamine 5'-phosphate oxidase